MQKSKIAKFISIVFVVTLIIGTISLFFVPQLYDLFKDENVMVFHKHSMVYKLTFYLGCIGGLSIVYELSKLFKFIYTDTPFKKEVENILKICAVIFMALAIIVLIKIIFIPTILSFAVTFVCFVASLSFYCLAEVIKAAIVYKDEVDATI